MKPKVKINDTPDPLDPNLLFQTVSTDAEKTETWFFREHDKILDLA